jgi:GntR family transcriptional repressor for pyruvate dehydrogenase complex
LLEERIQPLNKVLNNDKNALSNQIYNRIREWLRSGKLKEGDPLPSERELAQLFDVSRVPVREALKVLEFVGIVRSIRGKGVFVKKISPNDIINTIDFVMMDHTHTLLELFEVREGIETQAAYLAAERRTIEDLKNIESQLSVIDQNASKNLSSVDSTLDFHSAIIVASHNSALIEINHFLSEWLRFLRTKYIGSTVGNDIGRAEHRSLFELIEAKDCIGAANMMRSHLIRAKSVIAQAIQDLDR